MLFDVVWFTEHNQADALALVQKLPIEDIHARYLHDLWGLRVWQPAKIPNEDGSPGASGICIVRNFYGSSQLLGTPFEFYKDFKVVRPGLVAANLTSEFFSQPHILQAEQAHRERDPRRIAAIQKDMEAEQADKKAELHDLISRWCNTVGLLANVQKKLGIQEATDLAMFMQLTGKDIPNLQTWVAALGYSPDLPELTLSEDPIREAKEALGAHTLPDKIVRKKAG